MPLLAFGHGGQLGVGDNVHLRVWPQTAGFHYEVLEI